MDKKNLPIEAPQYIEQKSYMPSKTGLSASFEKQTIQLRKSNNSHTFFHLILIVINNSRIDSFDEVDIIFSMEFHQFFCRSFVRFLNNQNTTNNTNITFKVAIEFICQQKVMCKS